MYQLTEADTREPSGPEGVPAIIRASKLPDSRRLEALLELKATEKSPSSFLEAGTAGYYTSALLAAIKARLPANVSLLLTHGADPNGLPSECFGRHSVGFLRFRHPRWSGLMFPVVPSRDEALVKAPYPQTSTLTGEEIDARRISRARFWAEPTIPEFDFRYEAMTALEAAASTGNIQIFDDIHNAGADTAAWKCGRPYNSIPSQPSVSYLSISSPLHRAVEADQLPMVHHLLDLKFSTNVFPLASITCSLNPAMAAIANLKHPAYDLLAPHTDLSLTTPIYNVHILHFAAATLSLDLLLKVAEDTPLSNAPPTALLHTLLHIVCLPLNDTYINHHSPKCHASIHELRCLDRTTRNQVLHPHPMPNQPLRRNPNSSLSSHSTSSMSSDHTVQSNLLLYLLQHTSIPLGAQDIHGNTALHYLAGHRFVNTPLLEMLRNEHMGFGGEIVWAESRNRWGFTPQELFEEGDSVKGSGDLYMPFWKDPMGYWLGSKWVNLLQGVKTNEE